MPEGRIGAVGLGTMGGAMVAHLLDDGWHVTGFDVVSACAENLQDRGLRAAARLEDVAREADMVLVSVRNDEQLDVVVGGLLAAESADLLVIDTSTIDATASARIAERLERAGGALLRCPVSGSATLAAAGELVILCSGEAGDYARARPLLDSLGADHMFVGGGEDARVLKLLINLIVIGTMALLGEAVALGEAVGIDVERLTAAVNRSVIGSQFTRYKAAALVCGDFAPTASVALVRKDLELVRAMAWRTGVTLPMTEAGDSLYALCEESDGTMTDFAAIVNVFRSRHGQNNANPVALDS